MATDSEQIDKRVRVLGRPAEDYPAQAPEAQAGTARPITVVGEEILHKSLTPVAEADFSGERLAALISDMFATMYVAEGVGLAANQIGVDMRVFVYDCPDGDGVRHVGHICNPEVEELPAAARRLDDDDEGCLSVPGPYKKVARPGRAVVHGFDQHGNPVELVGTGYYARCLQHETDHLDGYLYIDRLSKRDRKDALKQMEAQRDEVFARRAANAGQRGK
jgi:peptide deformylase